MKSHKEQIFNRAGTQSVVSANKLAIHNANTLGGVWVVWEIPHTGAYRVTCPELVAGRALGRTRVRENGAVICSKGV